ncbi:MAG: DUF3391 domain-containing protein [Methylotenera sp.]|nr:DUF3391 domain-containing protein [Methylotenera sp.]
MQTNQPHVIAVEQLQIGMYIHLDLGWMDHPFTVSNFKIKDAEQIDKIKKTGLKRLRYDPARSDCLPLPMPAIVATTTATSVITNHTVSEDDAKSQATVKNARLKQLHRVIDENEKKFVIVSDMTRQISRNILSSPQASIEQAEFIINDMVDTALTEGDIAVHALNGNRSSDANYQHPLNVTVLALIMAKAIEMSKEDAKLLGMAALFHDIGKAEITDKILMKKDPLTKSEQAHYEQHSEFGARIAKEVGLPMRIGKIILQHHECIDGSGYPKHLKAEQIDPLSSLIALVNNYDNLCNPNNFLLAKTPYETLAYLYAHQRSKYDDSLLKRLIKSLGIYPPGSIVQLSTGIHAIVISVNPNKPLRPFVMLHDKQATRKEPLILDLREEPSVSISTCLRPNQLPPDVLDYLRPRNRISYFMDIDTSESQSATN